ncbi:MAG: hypothetical protein WBC33_05920 [Conexibacter sp.]
MMRFEPNFRLHILQLEIAVVLHHASLWSLLRGVGLVVNHGSDGTHKAGSLHGWNLALDLDTEGDRRDETAHLAGYLARILGPGYDVVFEGTHCHVEWDPHRAPPVLEANFPAAPAPG